MALRDLMLPEFDHEMTATLQRLSEAQFGWRPHSNSWSAGELATHIANLPS